MSKKLIPKFLCLYLILQSINPEKVTGQITISGTVYDSSKLYTIPDVYVYSTSGSRAITDSTGEYHINVEAQDSISFFYDGKSTIKFPVKSMLDYTAFDISLWIKVKQKYKLLSPVTVFSNSYRRDSIENREEYSKIFGSEKPGIHSNYEPGGSAGLDLDALIGMFQHRKNKQNLAFKNRLLQQEQDNYVDYRFSSKTISRITGLKGDELEKYKKLYRPTYFFVVNSTLTEFYEYILNTSYAFKKQEGIK
ncbi:MAG TPA: hypothetical protein VFI29_14075 [Hanamia sp.]|nr:hypothetical protein [Hanamia sp.]